MPTDVVLSMITAWIMCTPWLAFIWCCCTPAGCEYFEDDFSADNLATNYDARSGSFAVGSGVLTTSSDDALLVSNHTVPSGDTAALMGVRIKCSDLDDAGRAAIAYSGDDDYWFAEVEPGTVHGTLKLYERVGGVNTQRGGTLVLRDFVVDSWVNVCLSVLPDRVLVSAHVAGVATSQEYLATVSVTGTKSGVGTGTVVDTVTYDNYVVSKHHEDDEDCPYCQDTCVVCTCLPRAWQVVITGVENQYPPSSYGGPCTGCDQYNGTYFTKDWMDGDFAVAGTGCHWTKIITGKTGVCGNAVGQPRDYRLFVRIQPERNFGLGPESEIDIRENAHYVQSPPYPTGAGAGATEINCCTFSRTADGTVAPPEGLGSNSCDITNAEMITTPVLP